MRVPHLSPTTLTADEQRVILRATAGKVRDHTIISLALGTGLRLAEIVGLDVRDVFAPDGPPWVRVSPLTTTVYPHPSDAETASRVHELDC
jgi:integrase